METAVEIAAAAGKAAEQGGILFVLFLVIAGLVGLVALERRKNDKLTTQILENSKDMVAALVSFESALDGVKETIRLVGELRRGSGS